MFVGLCVLRVHVLFDLMFFDWEIIQMYTSNLTSPQIMVDMFTDVHPCSRGLVSHVMSGTRRHLQAWLLVATCSAWLVENELTGYWACWDFQCTPEPTENPWWPWLKKILVLELPCLSAKGAGALEGVSMRCLCWIGCAMMESEDVERLHKLSGGMIYQIQSCWILWFFFLEL